ncbi:MAG TPA: metalloregulator ArsR/SmtB family transcription factor [Candidatus Limnocylindrales bacterium]
MKPSTDPDVRILAALADPVRLSIVRQLSADGTVCACNFDACGTVSQPTVSHHLKVLRESGVVRAERRGTWIYYSLDPAVAERLRALAASLVPAGELPANALRGQRLPVLEQPTNRPS